MVIQRESVCPNSYWRLPAPTMSSVPYAESAVTLLESSLGKISHCNLSKFDLITLLVVKYISIILSFYFWISRKILLNFVTVHGILPPWVTALSGWENMLDILLYSSVLPASFPLIPPSTQCMWHLGSIGVPQMVIPAKLGGIADYSHISQRIFR